MMDDDNGTILDTRMTRAELDRDAARGCLGLLIAAFVVGVALLAAGIFVL